MCRCVFAVKPKLAGGPANVTRNVVFHEVLEGVNQPVPAAQALPSTEAGPSAVQEVEDISEWIDYDAIEAEMLSELDVDLVTEEMPISQEETRRRVEARERTPAVRQRQQPARQVSPQRVQFAELEPSCPYERCRDDIIADKKRFYEECFGVPYDSRTGIISQMLGHGDSDSSADEVTISPLLQ